MKTRLIPTGLIATVSTILLCSVASGHTIEDLKKEMKEVSDPLARITKAYETAQPGEIRERLHAAQHEMMITHQQGEMKLACIELLTKIPALERGLKQLQAAGKTVQAEQVQLGLDNARALATGACPTPLR